MKSSDGALGRSLPSDDPPNAGVAPVRPNPYQPPVASANGPRVFNTATRVPYNELREQRRTQVPQRDQIESRQVNMEGLKQSEPVNVNLTNAVYRESGRVHVQPRYKGGWSASPSTQALPASSAPGPQGRPDVRVERLGGGDDEGARGGSHLPQGSPEYTHLDVSSDSDSESNPSSGGFFESAPVWKTSFRDRLLAVLARQFKQMRGRPIMTASEFIVPLVFVCTTVALWASWGTLGTGDTELIHYEPRFDTSVETMRTTMAVFCYNASTGIHIPGLAPCAQGTRPFTCEGDDSELPYKDGSFCTYAPSFEVATLAYLVATVGNLTLIPPLDVLVAYKWAGLKYGGLNKAKTFADSFFSDLQFLAFAIAGPVYFAGSTNQTRTALLNYFTAAAPMFPSVFGGGFDTMAEASDVRRRQKRTWAIIELRELSETTLDAVIHTAASGIPSTGTPVNTRYSGGIEYNGADLYLKSGYLTFQQLVSDFYLSHVHNTRLGVANYMVAQAYPEYSMSPMLTAAYQIVPLIFVLAFLYPLLTQVKNNVLEKETRIREAMLIMGMKEGALHISTFIASFPSLFVVCALATAIVRVTFLDKIDVWVLFLVFFLYAITIVPLGGLISAFFSKARLAVLMTPVIYFIIVIPTFVMTRAQGPALLGFSVSSPSAFASLVTLLLQHQLGDGFGDNDFANVHDDPKFWSLALVISADFVVYYIFMLYFDAVLPKDWGTPKHPLFFIMEPVQWCCQLKEKRLEGGPDGRAENGVFEDDNYDNDVVQMEGLRKEYQRAGRKFVAVNNFYWGMRPGEISVLLGHNGAGKTTVLNMMTGMTEPDEGDCYVYGLSVRQELSLVRDEIGFCPQHNILWPELTCRDHLEFYAKIKGLKGWELEDAVCRMLSQTDLMEKKNYKSKDLSGGQKRKLSVAIAFVGGGRLVYLDEPTAGMDVGARRHVWTLLKNMSEFHTIMLTTHYMDEADLLGHRIGIMSHGRLKCSGSSMFLKSNLGVGYCIIISVNPETEVSSIDGLVEDHVDGAAVLSHNGVELSYQLPVRSAAQFPSLLEAIESNDELFGIRGYSLSATTLEEVFLKVSEEDLEGFKADVADVDLEPLFEYESASSIYREQCVAMFTKRFWNALRDRRMQCFQLVCPCMCILVAMLLSLVDMRSPDVIELSYGSLFSADKMLPLLPTAQCDEWWGVDGNVADAIRQETHYANGQQLARYLQDNWWFHDRPIYGSIACQDVDLAAAAGMSFANVFMYNGSSPHQAALNVATYYNMTLSQVSKNGARMKWSAGTFDGEVPADALKTLISAILIMVPFTFLPSNPVAWVVKERECGAMHQQRLAGLNFYVYWICNFVFDLVVYLIAVLLILLILALFQRNEFVGSDRIVATCVLFVVHGFTSTPMAYSLSFLFKEHSSAQTIMIAGNFAVGFLLLIVIYVLALKPATEATSDRLRWIFRIVPSYSIGEGVTDLMLLSQRQNAGLAEGVWDDSSLKWAVIYLVVEFPLFSALTLLIGSPRLRSFWGRLRYDRSLSPHIDSDEDSDVEEERAAVHEAEAGGKDSTDVIRVLDLQKKYANGKVAVKGVTFSVFPREVFAFLGTNGAGKTTTIAMLCQQFLPTGGSAYINGYDIVGQSGDAMASLGFCPQFDATFDLLTVEEHLNYYSQVHGIAKGSREKVIEALLRLCELTTYRKTLASQLSGGNRRKLSVAVCLVGGPQVVFLDEPSAGMDPVARRGMWTTIQRASKHCSIVLTTHHLEEVEALADIVAIMVDGTLRCIGDKIHLKNKFGSGFEMSIRIQSELYREDVEAFVRKQIPGAVLNELKSNRFVYELPSDSLLSQVFATLQAFKDQLGITDYCVSQTSIEQVFLRVGGSAVENVDD